MASLKKRIRDVEQGPDGCIYLLTDDGRAVAARDGGGVVRVFPRQKFPCSVESARGPVAQRLVQGTHRKVPSRRNPRSGRDEFRETFRRTRRWQP